MTTAFDSDREVLLARAMLNRYVGRDISQWLEDNDAIDLVIQDVLSRWRRGDDMAAFWMRYANSVEYAPADSPNEYREGFAEGEDLRSTTGPFGPYTSPRSVRLVTELLASRDRGSGILVCEHAAHG